MSNLIPIVALAGQIKAGPISGRAGTLKTLRDGGWDDTAEEVVTVLRKSHCLTCKDGWIDWLEKPQ